MSLKKLKFYYLICSQFLIEQSHIMKNCALISKDSWMKFICKKNPPLLSGLSLSIQRIPKRLTCRSGYCRHCVIKMQNKMLLSRFRDPSLQNITNLFGPSRNNNSFAFHRRYGRFCYAKCVFSDFMSDLIVLESCVLSLNGFIQLWLSEAANGWKRNQRCKQLGCEYNNFYKKFVKKVQFFTIFKKQCQKQTSKHFC